MLPKPLNARRIAFFGGIYSNYLALEALLEDARERAVERLYCLGDLGAFGPLPDRACDILRETGIPVVQGNYDNSVGNRLADCQCGYTDPRDNYFAKVSYDYTFRHTSSENKTWLRNLPAELRFRLGSFRVLLCHGSPRKMNEFLWETTTSDAFLNWLFKKYHSDIIVGTHTGLHWHREPSPGKHFINCGVIGRPPNDGQKTVVYTVINADFAINSDPVVHQPGPQSARTDPPQRILSREPPTGSAKTSAYHDTLPCHLQIDFVRLTYDDDRLATEMASEGLPDEFIETIRTGWWTTCNEILPAKERRRGTY